MSRAEKITVAIGIASLILMAVPTWDVLDKRNLVTASILIGSWLCGAGMLIYSATRMLKDIGRAKRVTATLELERSIHMGSMADLQEELRKRQERLEREAARHQVKIVP
jgi:hypothetical protein